VTPRIDLYDTTLRDGAQGPGVKFSAQDQLKLIRELDAFGIRYIEGGQPAANPKAAELFHRVRGLELKHATITAFGSTRHPRHAPEDDPNLAALLSAQTNVVTVFAKSWRLHAEEILGITTDQNIALVTDSVAFLRSHGRRVFVDAEHFFDGHADDAGFAIAVLESAAQAGAETLVLCDTNGGCLPHRIEEAVRAVRAVLPNIQLGIHTHNDTGCAVANAIAAVRAGVTQVQGTLNGYGERTGNMNLCTAIPALQLKLGYELVSDAQLARLTHLSHIAAEFANTTPRDHAPYVGRDAFTHKGGMHANAVTKQKISYEHIDPSLVGNATHFAVSEVSGRSSLIQKAAEFGIRLERDRPETRQILERIKNLENQGYEFEGADASLELIMRRVIGGAPSFFETLSFHAHINQIRLDEPAEAEATVKLRLPKGQVQHTVAEGHGPVDALNNALRKALDPAYPELREIHLEDYKVRIVDGRLATQAMTRVLIESSDNDESWYTVGVSENIITASYIALADSIAYKLLRARPGGE